MASTTDHISSDEFEETRQTMFNVSSLWSQFNLPERNVSLEQSAAQSRDLRDQSQAARKHLSECTKKFRRVAKLTEQSSTTLAASSSLSSKVDKEVCNAIDDVVKSVDSLSQEGRTTIKSYQEEIDKLTRRCKHSDAALSAMQMALADLPDPASVITDVMQRFQSITTLVHDQANTIQVLQIKNQSLLQDLEKCKNENEATTESMKGGSETSGNNTDTTIDLKNPPHHAMSNAEREELVQLRREVSEYEVEFSSLQNQDITIRKLEQKLSELQRSTDDTAQLKLQQVRDELSMEHQQQYSELKHHEVSLQHKIQSLELTLKTERAGLAATQNKMFEQDEGLDEREAAWEVQRTILASDAERLREQLYECARERDDLRLRVAALAKNDAGRSSLERRVQGNSDNSGDQGESMYSNVDGTDLIRDMDAERKAYEAEVREMTMTNTALREEQKEKDDAMMEERRNWNERVSSLDADRSSLAAQLALLEKQIASFPSMESVETMRHELRILKRIEFNVDDACDEGNSRDPEMTNSHIGAASSSAGHDVDLETVLIERLRRTEADLVKTRREKSDLEEECKSLAQRMDNAEKNLKQAQDLIVKLESDLEKAIVSPPNWLVDDKTSSSSVPFSSHCSDPALLQHILYLGDTSTSAEMDSAKGAAGTPPSPVAAKEAKLENQKDDHSVVAIIMAQRERLRARCDALETERDSFKRELQDQVRSSDSLKSDNTKLYEKVRYLQNYASKFSSSTAGRARSSAPIPRGDTDLDLEALEERYEATVDPFRQFSRSERQRKVKEMSPMERVVFTTAKTVLATKQLRTALFFYVLGMHLLVFITTHHWSHGSSTCHEALSDHPNVAHLHHGVPQLESAIISAAVGP